MRFEKIDPVNPLAHCQARMALYYGWVELAKAQPYGSRELRAAQDDYHRHIGLIEDEEENCEVCMEHDKRRGNNAGRKRKLYLEDTGRSAGAGRVLSGDAV